MPSFKELVASFEATNYEQTLENFVLYCEALLSIQDL